MVAIINYGCIYISQLSISPTIVSSKMYKDSYVLPIDRGNDKIVR